MDFTKKHGLLRLFVDKRKQVWFAAPNDEPSNSKFSVVEFTETPLFKGTKGIAAVMQPDQFDLLNAAYYRLKRGALEHIYVTGPRTQREKFDFNSPTKVLNLMLKQKLPSSVGGWRELTHTELSTLCMATLPNKNQKFLTAMMIIHPLRPHIDFVEKINFYQVAKLLIKIVDPRHHLDIKNPNLLADLFDYLHIGVNSNELAVNEINKCWEDGIKSKSSHKTFFAEGLKSGVSRLIIARMFVRFVVYGWLNMLSLSHRGHLFVPELFFPTEEHAKAYREEVKTII